MRIIIGGAGEVGRGVARALYNEGQDVVLIDSDPIAIKESQSIDAFVLLGDVTRREILKEAGINNISIINDNKNFHSMLLLNTIKKNPTICK